MTHKLFVYGSLKEGFGNHDLLESSNFLGSYHTEYPHYRMMSLGGFPGVIELDDCGQHHYILGELYEVDDITLARIDMLEGNGHFYTRKLVELSETDDTILAWMYLLPPSFLDMNYENVYSRSQVAVNERTNWQLWSKS